MKVKKTKRIGFSCGVRQVPSRGPRPQKDHIRDTFKLESVTMARLAALGI
jgi:hypothetical protein